MAIEEPSVIAAASSAAKFIGENGGGFNSYSTEVSTHLIPEYNDWPNCCLWCRCQSRPIHH